MMSVGMFCLYRAQCHNTMYRPPRLFRRDMYRLEGTDVLDVLSCFYEAGQA